MIFIDGIAYGDRVRSRYQWKMKEKNQANSFLGLLS